MRLNTKQINYFIKYCFWLLLSSLDFSSRSAEKQSALSAWVKINSMSWPPYLVHHQIHPLCFHPYVLLNESVLAFHRQFPFLLSVSNLHFTLIITSQGSRKSTVKKSWKIWAHSEFLWCSLVSRSSFTADFKYGQKLSNEPSAFSSFPDSGSLLFFISCDPVGLTKTKGTI